MDGYANPELTKNKLNERKTNNGNGKGKMKGRKMKMCERNKFLKNYFIYFCLFDFGVKSRQTHGSQSS